MSDQPKPTCNCKVCQEARHFVAYYQLYGIAPNCETYELAIVHPIGKDGLPVESYITSEVRIRTRPNKANTWAVDDTDKQSEATE